MKHVAQDARLETRVLSQVLENRVVVERDSGGVEASGTASGIVPQPPPGVAKQGVVAEGNKIPEEEDIVGHENIYLDVDNNIMQSHV